MDRQTRTCCASSLTDCAISFRDSGNRIQFGEYRGYFVSRYFPTVFVRYFPTVFVPVYFSCPPCSQHRHVRALSHFDRVKDCFLQKSQAMPFLMIDHTLPSVDCSYRARRRRQQRNEHCFTVSTSPTGSHSTTRFSAVVQKKIGFLKGCPPLHQSTVWRPSVRCSSVPRHATTTRSSRMSTRRP